MTILPLVIAPDHLLKQISDPVEKVDDELRLLMNNMLQTMYDEHGIGLAAVQVGVLKRVLVIDLDYKIEHDHNHDHDDHDCGGTTVTHTSPRFFVNPEIVNFSSETSLYNEGCLSFPGVRSDVIRPRKIKVKFLDYNGVEKTEEMSGLLATCIQHEIDHLNGVVFVDHISKLKRDMILKKMVKMKRNEDND